MTFHSVWVSSDKDLEKIYFGKNISQDEKDLDK